MPRLIAAATTVLFWGMGANAQQPQPASEARIVVTGEGSVSVTPNYAQIRSGVTTRSKTVKEGVDANSKQMVAITQRRRHRGEGYPDRALLDPAGLCAAGLAHGAEALGL
jgi:uncharacterized protein YggE